MPTVSQFMTREPYSVASTDSLRRAHDLMHRHEIRHLPVLDGGRLVGVLADRDITVIGALPGVDLHCVEVSHVMESPLDVWGETPLDQVSDLMLKRKRDCVIVRGGHGVEGIFTATDALQALANLVRRATG